MSPSVVVVDSIREALYHIVKKIKTPITKTIGVLHNFLMDYAISPSYSHPGCVHIICITKRLMMLALSRNEPLNNKSKR